MQPQLQKCFSNLGYTPVLFAYEEDAIKSWIKNGETILAFADAWIDKFGEDGTVYITNERVVFQALTSEKKLLSDTLSWEEIKDVHFSITPSVSTITIVANELKDFYRFYIDSAYVAREFTKVAESKIKTTPVTKENMVNSFPILQSISKIPSTVDLKKVMVH